MTTFEDAVRRVRAGSLSSGAAADGLVAALTDDELLWLLDGDLPVRAAVRLPALIKAGPVVAGAIPRLGIPGIRFSDGPRGVVMGRSTAFPVTMERAATWDPALEERVGLAMGAEARALGANYSGAVCVNLLRHPAWGRAQECYGEDPVLTGRMGAALTRGLRRNVMACVKHFALNSIENARFRVDVEVDAHPLHEVYLPHFKAVVDAGAESVMSAYNAVNGAHADQNAVLLTDILRDEWGFTGFVTSDWVWGTHDAVTSLEAGLDVEMPLRMHRARHLRVGPATRPLVLRSARRILATTVGHYAARDPDEPAVDASAHRSLAHEVAVRGAVLLRNEPVDGTPLLPLRGPIRRLAVLGRLATAPNLGDRGSSMVDPPTTSSPLAGLRAALPAAEVSHVDSAAAAASADAAVVVVGMGPADEGERITNDDPASFAFLGFPFTLRPVQRLAARLARRATRFGPGGDRTSLTLHGADEALIAAVAAANPRTVVVVIGGSAILMESWRSRVPAILLAWYPGMAGGAAIADILTGAAEPGGRLPFAVPTDADHLPFFDRDAKTIRYDAWWGQRKLDRDGRRAAYPFGFGLGYTTFEIALREVSDVAGVRVTNTGGRAGSTVVQLYAFDADAERPVPQLIGFQRVALDPGAVTDVEVALDLTPTRRRDPATRTWSRRPGRWRVVAAAHHPDSFAGAVDLTSSSDRGGTGDGR
ncbi:glycoside hydrolase family 3 C-terminal domain-containing protein [Asanoa sp. WMMD1127]|uniref:beta-glucosidase n=1 Tax=Asanoa sp. WMMD1127 TaxID=3016107 RepID=UPI0024171D24|nr:glycoside hydrolase family 3 C-terminal domain-containing protein [Asanoa sp. WMMD1127]MDG4826342.1 glycoside hydrolase family 3 C-terminal domain-containing protein [Asanoa sp. WMMD1127]